MITSWSGSYVKINIQGKPLIYLDYHGIAIRKMKENFKEVNKIKMFAWLSWLWRRSLFHLLKLIILTSQGRTLNPISSRWCQINTRQLKITTILERFYALAPYFIIFSFQVLSIISEKNGPERASLFRNSYTNTNTNPNPTSFSNPNTYSYIASKCH